MKIYKVKVNGKLYEVELEAVSENNASIASEAKAPVAAAPTSGNSTVVPAPITGKVVALKVNVGDTVTAGQVIGAMGNTGYVIPAPTYSNPYGGTHLHFCLFKGEPYRGGYAINPYTVY